MVRRDGVLDDDGVSCAANIPKIHALSDLIIDEVNGAGHMLSQTYYSSANR